MALHALAERLGYTVRELAQRLTLAELRDWLAYDRLRNPDRTQAGDQAEADSTDDTPMDRVRRMMGVHRGE